MIRLQVLVVSLAGTLMAEANPRLEYATGVLEERRGVSTARDHFEKARLADPQARPLVRGRSKSGSKRMIDLERQNFSAISQPPVPMISAPSLTMRISSRTKATAMRWL